MKLLRILIFVGLLFAFLVPSVLADSPSRGVLPASYSTEAQPMAPGPVLAKPSIISSFYADPLHRGVDSIGLDGRDGTVWVSSKSVSKAREYTYDGRFTGRERTSYYADMAYDYSHNLMYQMQVNNKYVIRTWNPRTGLPGQTITDPDGVWNQVPHAGICYSGGDTDIIYIGGSTDNKIYKLKGLMPRGPGVPPDPGRVLQSWDFTQPGTITGLAWLGDGQIAVVTNSPDVIYVINATTMGIRYKFSIPGGGVNAGGGIDAQTDGTAWIINKSNGVAYHISLAVALQNPAKDQVLTVGFPYTLTWLATPLADHFKVMFTPDNGTTWQVIAPNVATTTFSWTPVVQQNRNQCKVKVIAYDSANVNLGSNQSYPFKVEAIHFTAPAAGTTYASNADITGTFTFGPTVKTVNYYNVLFTKDGGVTWQLLGSSANLAEGYTPGTPYSFTYSNLSVGQTRTKCAFRVVLKNDDGTKVAKAQSPMFTITP